MVYVRSPFKMFFGLMFVVFGLFSIFDVWGILAFEVPWQVWPVGLIVVGVLFMVRQKGLALVVILLLMVLGIFSSGWSCCDGGESREFVRGFDLNGVEYVDLHLEYGAGSIMLVESDYDKIIFEATTGDLTDPEIKEEVFESGAKKVISISRGEGFGFGAGEDWNVFLGDDVVYDLNLEYGASDVSLDLRGLKVDRLEISEGVSDSRIVMGEYPTKVFMKSGISDVDFEFAEGYGVVVEVDGGLLDKDFDEFEKRDGKWFSEGFVEGGENVEVVFSGGVGDLSASFY